MHIEAAWAYHAEVTQEEEGGRGGGTRIAVKLRFYSYREGTFNQSINQSINEFIRFQNKVTKLYKKKLKLNRISTITKYNNLYNIVLLY